MNIKEFIQILNTYPPELEIAVSSDRNVLYEPDVEIKKAVLLAEDELQYEYYGGYAHIFFETDKSAEVEQQTHDVLVIEDKW